jgi:hypothetical protein
MDAAGIRQLLGVIPFREGHPVDTLILMVCVLVVFAAPVAIVLAILSVRRKRSRRNGRHRH